MRRYRLADSLCGWMFHVPLVGNLMATFWAGVIADGLWAMVKPRWGGMTFSFLNDGIHPTLWHTWRSVRSRDEGIWVDGAPHSQREADAKMAGYRERWPDMARGMTALEDEA